MNYQQSLELKQQLHCLQAEHLLGNLCRPLSLEVKASIKVEINGQLEQAMEAQKALDKLEKASYLCNSAMLEAYRRDPSLGVPEYFCRVNC